MPQLTIPQALTLAVQHHRAGRLGEAEQLYRQVLAQQPENADALHFLGVLAHQVGRNDLAVDLISKAIALNPNWPDAYSNLGTVLQEQGQMEAAIAAHRRAVALKPNSPEAYGNLGNALWRHGQRHEAVAAWQQAVALHPNYPDAHHNLSLALLLAGEYRQGWEKFEWRWQRNDYRALQRNFAQPQWDGRPLAGTTILLHAEQGLGDTLQFVRYVPLVAQRGGRVILECQPELQRLLQAVHTDIPVVTKGQSLPHFDLHCPLLSLPRVIGTTLGNIPRQIPYLQANAQAAQTWQNRLAAPGPVMKIGLAWAGSPTHNNDRQRSLKLADLARLAGVSGVRFYSLQKGAAAGEAKAPPPGMELTDWTPELNDFAATAALLAHLDLVIAVDTAVVHLAGAMGKPVWTMIPFVPDWRWLLEREDSPWYPTMRLFRQPRIGDWDSVIARMALTLSALRRA